MDFLESVVAAAVPVVLSGLYFSNRLEKLRSELNRENARFSKYYDLQAAALLKYFSALEKFDRWASVLAAPGGWKETFDAAKQKIVLFWDELQDAEAEYRIFMTPQIEEQAKGLRVSYFKSIQTKIDAMAEDRGPGMGAMWMSAYEEYTNVATPLANVLRSELKKVLKIKDLPS